MDTIIALSTPIGRSAIAVIRLSGDNCLQIARQIFDLLPTKPNVLKVGNLVLPNFTDKAMCVYFLSPHSYTGQDMVEFHVHGGAMVANLTIARCIELGCRLAYNGEFSKRAFIMGKQNLSSAEGIIEIIDAESVMQLKAGANLTSDKLGKTIINLQDKLTDLIATCEATLDYPEENLEEGASQNVSVVLSEIKQKLQVLLDTTQVGKAIKYGINAVIAGKTNVGKSSLLNALLGQSRAIVSNIAGTTRDTITESIIYKDAKINFIDTAGLRTTTRTLESEGIKRTNIALDQCDVIIYVTDKPNANLPLYNKPTIYVCNKCDLLPRQDNDKLLYVSALNNINIEQLKQQIFDMFRLGTIDQNQLILTNARHVDVLARASHAINCAIEATNLTLDCIVEDIKIAWSTLGEITGTTANQDIIDRIYQKFCLGK
ncbi:MAG: tRNA uridine-5-carboxymethylaminomethyl(34) synthesis GTPase MnmE [Clostridia bacterium]